MKEGKKESRMRRAAKTRHNIQRHKMVRLTIHRTPQHIYAQVISADGRATLAAASSVEKELRQMEPQQNKTAMAEKVGEKVAQRAIEAGVHKIAFDRSGFKYHGRVKALAEAARAAGLGF